MLVNAVCSSQDKDYNFIFSTANERFGLISDQINCITSDQFGYIWVGTQSGLSRYDGTKFTSVRHDPKIGVAGNSIADLATDNKGMIWIVSERGINKYNPIAGGFTYYPKYNEHSATINYNFQCDKIFPQENGWVIAFANYGQAFLLEKDSTIFRPIYQTFFDSVKIRNFYIDKEKTIWALSEKTSRTYLLDTIGNLKKIIDCKDKWFPNITQGNYAMYDDGDKIYFGGEYGIVIYNKNKDKFENLDVENPEDMPLNARVFYRDKLNRFWIGTNADDLHFIDPNTNRIIKIPSSSNEAVYKLNSSTVNDITEDDNGLVWFGTWKGISYTELSPTKKFYNISREENKNILHKNYIYCFSIRNDGTMAIASDGGGITYWRKGEPSRITCYDPAITPNTAMESSSTLAVAFDSAGNCYSGGYNRCLSSISADGKTCTVYPYNPDQEDCMASNFVKSILIDKKQRIWVYTNGGGLHLLNPKTKKFKRIKTDRNGTPINLHGISITQSKNEKYLYLGTYLGFQIYDLENDIVKSYENNDNDSTTLSHNWVYQIFEDSQGRIWVATDAGLDLFDQETGTFTRYNKNAGFENTVINGILEDNNGMFWVSTARGLAKFNPDMGLVERTYHISDGLCAETVLMRFDNRSNLSMCVSSQVGCKMGCSFCATGKRGFIRNLNAKEIIEQVLTIQRDTGLKVTNIVFMGQGEPLLNLDNVLEALNIFNEDFQIGARRITISTSGIIPQINKLADMELQSTLAISLHAPNHEIRKQIMPIENKYNIDELKKALKNYIEKTGRRITFEYLMIRGLNDTHQCAKQAALFMKDLKCNVNLIPYNSVDKTGYQKSSGDAIMKFKYVLEHSGKKVTVRLERGADIDAACGQLSGKTKSGK